MQPRRLTQRLLLSTPGTSRQAIHSLFLLLLLSTYTSSIGQSVYIPEPEWKAALSKEHDTFNTAFDAIFHVLVRMDSSARIEKLKTFNTWATNGNIRLQIRSKLMAARLAADIEPRNLPYARDLINSAIAQAYEIEDEVLLAYMHVMLAGTYMEIKEYSQALLYYMIGSAFQKSSGLQHSRQVALTQYFICWNLYHTHQYEEAAQYCQQALDFHTSPVNPGDTLSAYYLFHARNTLGLSYTALKAYPEAIAQFDQAIREIQVPSDIDQLDTLYTALVQGNLGDVLFAQGKYDSAEVLLKLDVQQSLSDKLYNNASNSLQYLARLYALRDHNYPLALATARDAERIGRIMPSAEYRERLLYTYALIFHGLDRADSLYHYMTQYQVLHDSLEHSIMDGRSDFLRLQLGNREYVRNIQLLRAEKERIALIRNFAIGLIVLMSITGYLYFNRSNLRMRMKQQEHQQAQQQLSIFTEHLKEKTAMLEQLQERWQQKEQTQENLAAIDELAQYTILTDKDWDEFKLAFTKVYPGFLSGLRHRVPDITLSEQRMAALTKMKVPTKEAAQILGISPVSVRKARQRLRQRLGLATEEELDAWIHGDHQ